MKTVTIEGKEYEVPDKANYVAMDKIGSWWWHEFKAEKGSRGWEQGGYRGFITKSESWESTLRKI